MPDETATIVSALIGAIIGSIGTSIVGNWLTRRAEKKRIYENVVQQYLLQMQDAAESLWYRLYNIQKLGGRTIMADPYYETTTLYVLAKVLALKHIVVLEGVSYNIERIRPGLGIFLRDKLEAIDKRLDNMNYEIELKTPFYRYDRQMLAESVMKGEGDRLRTSTFTDFKESYEGIKSTIRVPLVGAKEFILALDDSNVGTIRKHLSDIAQRLQEETGIKSGVRKLSSDKKSIQYSQELGDDIDEVVSVYDNKLTSGQISSNDFWQKYLMPVLLRLQKESSLYKLSESDNNLLYVLLQTIPIRLTDGSNKSILNNMQEIRRTYSKAIRFLQKFVDL